MNPIEPIKKAFRTLRGRPLESMLIVLAVALGVSVVTVMLALLLNSAAFNSRFERSLEGRVVRVVGKVGDRNAFEDTNIILDGVGLAQKVDLTKENMNALRSRSPAVQYAYMFDDVYTNNPDVPGLNASDWSQIMFRAVTPDFIPAAGLKLLEGSWPTAEDFALRKPVVAVSEAFAKRWFARERVIGRKITGRELSFTVIGVFATPDTTAEFQSGDFSDYNAAGIAPLNSGVLRESYSVANTLNFVPFPGQDASARTQLEAAARELLGDTVRLRSSANAIEKQRQLAFGTTLMTVLFASGGLVIASLNITNLMLARVLQRTRWIGISRALGASQRRIFRDFLLEASLLGGGGALLGLGFAQALVAGLNGLIQDAVQLPGFALEVQPAHFVIGFAVGVGVNLLFAAYPAWIASSVQPSSAMRST